VPVIEALEQCRQVFADGAVHQVADRSPSKAAEVIHTPFEVIEHVRVDLRRERADHGFFDARGRWARATSVAAPPQENDMHVFGGEVVDQLQQDLPFDFLGQQLLMQVVGF
jgi:hypothetical protein